VRYRTDGSEACGYFTHASFSTRGCDVFIENLSANSIGADEIARGHMKSILDPSFRYTSSVDTDLQKTFARIRRDHRQEAERAVQAAAATLAKVSSIVRKTATDR
jgi:hypothetical protein